MKIVLNLLNNVADKNLRGKYEITILVSLSAQAVQATESDLCKKLNKFATEEAALLSYSYGRSMTELGYNSSQSYAVGVRAGTNIQRYAKEQMGKAHNDALNEVMKSMGCK